MLFKSYSGSRAHKQKLTMIALGFAVLSLVGCEVGPDYATPNVALPEKWVSANSAQSDGVQIAWWKNFNDPILDTLIQKAVANNLDFKIAEARVAEARATRAAAKASLFPSGGAQASATREANQFAVPGNFPGITQPFNIFQAGFDASWELDLFGGHRRDIESATAEVELSEASRDDAVVSLLAEVARTYIDIRQYQEQIKIANDTIASDKKTTGIARQRFEAGTSPRLDLTQAEAEQEQEQAELPYYQNLVAQAEFAMDVLLGEQPGASANLISTPKSIPVAKGDFVLAAPAAVIANRPDIRVAERKVASATGQQGVATAKFFPDVSLSGFVGLLNTNSSNFLTFASKSWSMGATAVLPIFNYPTLSANLDYADAEQKEAMIQYQKSVLMALSDVERSVTAYDQQVKYEKALDASAAADRHANAIAGERYKEGLTSFIEVLDAERTSYIIDSKVAQAHAQSSEDLVAVYKSLGGGWKP